MKQEMVGSVVRWDLSADPGLRNAPMPRSSLNVIALHGPIVALTYDPEIPRARDSPKAYPAIRGQQRKAMT